MTPAEAEEQREWFTRLCDRYRASWEKAIADELGATPGPSVAARRRAIEELLATNAAKEVERMEKEIDRMLVRTSIIVAAATLLFAVYAIKASVGLGLILATVAFILALVPMSPPVRRAWTQSFVPRHIWTLLTTSHFKCWVMDCWLADRRTKVVTRYKKFHAVAIPILGTSAVVTGVYLLFTFIFK